MASISRRSFLSAAVGAAAVPAFGRVSGAAETDIAVVGAGAAGIAAARRIIAAGRRTVVLEAADRVGGRCVTDHTMFGVPYDLGARWLHVPEANPLARLAPQAGIEIYPAPPGQKVRVGRRNARESELEQFLAVVARGKRAIEDAARGKADISCAQALPKDLGEWQPSMEFYLGPFSYGKDLAELSVADVTRVVDSAADASCRQGLGTLLAKLAEGLPVQTATPVTRINMQGRAGIVIETAKGSLTARAVIVTASTNVLLGGKLAFAPELPKRQIDALSRLALGAYERVALDLPDNPLGLARDDLVFEKADGKRTAALLANVGGTRLAYIDIAGSFGRELAARGPHEMTAFAIEWIEKLFGSDAKKALRRSHATQWAFSPWVQGGFSAASVGGQPSRRILMEPVRDRLFLAGEAAHETLWGTVGGAWQSGERAAEAALKLIPASASATPAKKQSAPPRQRRQPRPQQQPFGVPRISTD